MKVERLTDGSPDCPLVRLFDFTSSEAESLRKGVRCLADGQRERLDLEDCGVTPVDGFALSFVAGHRDVGLASELGRFAWVLRAETWDKIEGLIEPFTKGLTGFQWLSKDGGTSLLISPDGTW